MADFQRSVKLVLSHEGGFVDHPEDPGGATNFGISQRAYPFLNIRELTIEEAIEIYRRDYWQRDWEEIKSQRVADLLMLMAVNAGTKRAVRFHQRACNKCGEGLKIDGVFGPHTLASTNGIRPVKLVAAIQQVHIGFYVRLAKLDHPFFLGWVRRVLEVA